MPPVVEWRGGDHGDASPRRDEGTKRATEPPQLYRGFPQRGIAAEGSRENQVPAGDSRQHTADVHSDVRRRPKAVAPDGPVPGDVPVNPAHGESHGCDRTPDIPRHGTGSG